MKVLLINGSPHEKGCTYTALKEICGTLESEHIETEIFWLGKGPFHSCQACNVCAETGRCVFNDDPVNPALEKFSQADALIIGSPVHYAAASGAVTAFLDRFFYAGENTANKPGAAIVSCRRSGATAALEQLWKYFTISNMPLVSSQYWPMVHGHTPEDVRQDEEGLQTMRQLGRNMAWLLKCIENGKAAGIPLPAHEERKITNFIR